jgi:hypothetical protein
LNGPTLFDLANPLKLVSRLIATDLHDEAGTAERDAREKHDVEANVDDITAGLGFRGDYILYTTRCEV